MIVAFDKNTGQEQWSYDGPGGSAVDLVADNGVIYYGEFFNGEVIAYDIASQNVLWSVEHYEGGPTVSDGRVQTPFMGEGVLHVGISSGMIYGLDPSMERVFRLYSTQPRSHG